MCRKASVHATFLRTWDIQRTQFLHFGFLKHLPNLSAFPVQQWPNSSLGHPIAGWIPRLFQKVVQKHGSRLLALLLVSSYPLAGSIVSGSSRHTIRQISSNSTVHLTSLGFPPYNVGDFCRHIYISNDASLLHAVWWSIRRQNLR